MKNSLLTLIYRLTFLIAVAIFVVTTISEQHFRARGLLKAYEVERTYLISFENSNEALIKALRHNRSTWDDVIIFGWQKDRFFYHINENSDNKIYPNKNFRYRIFPWINLANSYLYALTVIFCGVLGSLIISIRSNFGLLNTLTLGLIAGFIPYLGINLLLSSFISKNHQLTEFSPYTSASFAFIYGLISDKVYEYFSANTKRFIRNIIEGDEKDVKNVDVNKEEA